MSVSKSVKTFTSDLSYYVLMCLALAAINYPSNNVDTERFMMCFPLSLCSPFKCKEWFSVAVHTHVNAIKMHFYCTYSLQPYLSALSSTIVFISKPWKYGT